MLTLIQTHLQSIYRIEAPDIRQFVIDEEQLREIAGEDIRNADEWVLARPTDGGLDLAVYIAAPHLDDLQRVSSLPEAADRCFRAFCSATEGVSHFLMLVDRARRNEPVTLLELEAQAEVDKFVSARLHHPLRTSEWWDRLFRDARLSEGLDAEEVHRYQEAGRLAASFCSTLDELPHVDALLRLLRRFWRDSGTQRLDRMRRLAA